MDLLLAFLVGWAAGARGGEQGMREVVDAARELRRSEEFGALVDALRSHLAATLRTVADVVADSDGANPSATVLERVARLTARNPLTSSGS